MPAMILVLADGKFSIILLNTKNSTHENVLQNTISFPGNCDFIIYGRVM
jgi:hypothetical protein